MRQQRAEIEHVILPPHAFWDELCRPGTRRLAQTSALRDGRVFHCPRFSRKVESHYLVQGHVAATTALITAAKKAAELEALRRRRKRIMAVLRLAVLAFWVGMILVGAWWGGYL